MLQAENMHSMTAGRSPQQRFVSFAIVAGLHVAVIAAFIMALKPNIIAFHVPTDLTITIPTPDPTPPQPRHPAGQPTMLNPTAPPIPMPQWTEKDTITPPIAPPVGEGGNEPALPTRSPVALFSTHSSPPYPPNERRLGNEGNVQLRLSIDADGQVTTAEVVRSSGHDDLDEAAARWVKAHWRYLPALQNGLAVASTTNAIVTFRLTASR